MRCVIGTATSRKPRNSVHALDTNADVAWAVENRSIARDFPENDDAGLGDTTAAVIDDKVVGTPEPERSGGKVALARNLRQGRRKISGLLLTQMILHVDSDRQHLQQRTCRVVVGQAGGDISPFGGNQNAFLSHGMACQQE